MRLSILMTFWISFRWMACFTDTSRISNYDITFLLVLLAFFSIISKYSKRRSTEKNKYVVVCVNSGSVTGFYDGFFGPGTGSLIALAFILLCGYSATRATANAKILNFTSNFALLYFIIFGQIDWTIGLIMMLGQIIGSYIGAKMVLTKGTALIRPIVVIVCCHGN